MDFKAESGVGYWKEQGADTWNPFKSGHEPYIADLTFTTCVPLKIEVDFRPTVIAVHAQELTYYTNAGVAFAIRDVGNWSLNRGSVTYPLICTFEESSVTITQTPGDSVTPAGSTNVPVSIKVAIM